MTFFDVAGRTVSQHSLKYDVDDLAGEDLNAWYSAESPEFYDLDGSSLVETAYDRGPLGINITQATAGLRPGIVTLGGRDWFDFSLTGQRYLLGQGPTGLNSYSFSGRREERTAFISGYLPYATHTSLRRTMLSSYPEYYGAYFEVAADNTFTWTMHDGSVESAVEAGSPAAPLQSVFIVAGQFRAFDFVYLWKNGTLVDSDNGISDPTTIQQTGYVMGEAYTLDRPWDGYIGEIVVIDRLLTADEMALGFEILTQRWV